ncbi:acyl-CoA dehydrogenase [Thalassobaculum fulvum]|uniref:Acyl-[acyl-carrier-protein] dehydrogenase MbtN n=1 Tax=Thalassobaculum fulvum TaxID=1633335 RepID=A0A918XN14_9PROT|nr:acyl-CoA dehydrogenase family protein [Thalassobaculum fulvum]GHD40743.1 acyl-CoA dehydrogenase [Thalassobaculum fulvum]
MTEPLFREEHALFRETARRFVEAEVAPHHARWEQQGVVDREVWHKAGEAGLLLTNIPEEYGGGGADFLTSVVMIEEMMRHVYSGPGFRLHSDIVAPYILHYGSEDLKREWLPRMACGEVVTAIAMTEPGTGSDLQGVRTTAVRDGNHYVINGQKTFITNGQLADLIVVVCKTDPSAGAKGTSLILVEADRAGFSRGRNLEKIGLKAQDTSELFFDEVRVPITNLLGEENQGFRYLMQELPQERLLIAISAVTVIEAALQWTLDYTRQRQAFGRAIADFQNTRFRLAEVKTEATVARVFLNDCLARHLKGELDVPTAAMAKWWLSELMGKVVDTCLQLHGGYGYMTEFPIARAYADARVHRIYGGTTEIMKEIIARSL